MLLLDMLTVSLLTTLPEESTISIEEFTIPVTDREQVSTIGSSIVTLSLAKKRGSASERRR